MKRTPMTEKRMIVSGGKAEVKARQTTLDRYRLNYHAV